MTKTLPNLSDGPLLTALERELLGYVQRLTKAMEDSAAQFEALEKRSTGQIAERLNALEGCVSSLLRSQISLTGAFSTLAPASNGLATWRQDFSEAETALRDAAARMTEASR